MRYKITQKKYDSKLILMESNDHDLSFSEYFFSGKIMPNILEPNEL